MQWQAFHTLLQREVCRQALDGKGQEGRVFQRVPKHGHRVVRHVLNLTNPALTEIIRFHVNYPLLIVGLAALPKVPRVYLILGVFGVTKHEHDDAAHVGQHGVAVVRQLGGVGPVFQRDAVELALVEVGAPVLFFPHPLRGRRLEGAMEAEW